MINSSIYQRFDLLSGKRIAVIGSSGYIGSHVVDSLLYLKCPVVAISRSFPGLLDPVTLQNPLRTTVDISINDYSSLKSVLAGVDIVIHLASSCLPQTSNDDPLADIKSNLIGSLNILESCMLNKIQKIIFISSGGTVYGRPEFVPITEDHATNPICSYGIIKLAIEKYLYLYRDLYNIDAIILRLANPYGGRQRLNSMQGVVPVFLYRALNSLPLQIWGDGSAVRDFLYISDVVQAILSSCVYSGSEYLFNIGSGSGTSLRELVSLIEDLIDARLSVVYQPSRSFDVSTNVLSINKAIRELGWKPTIPPSLGLQKYYESLLVSHRFTPGM